VSRPEDEKRGFTRVEAATFQSVEGVPIRPWFPDHSVDVTAWAFDGRVYGEPVNADGADESDADAPPTVEELTADLEASRAETANERAARDRDADVLRTPYEEAALRMDTALSALDQRLSGDVVAMAQMMAETLIAREAATDASILVENLTRALDRLGPVEHLRIEANPEDVARLREIAPSLAGETTGRAVDVIVTAAPRLTRGGMVLSFDRGVIDASWGSQLGHLGEAVALAFDEERLASEMAKVSETTQASPQPEAAVDNPPDIDADASADEPGESP
jgi:hypothetical protein